MSTEWDVATEDLWRIAKDIRTWHAAYRAQLGHQHDRKLNVVALHIDFASDANTPTLRRWHAAAAAKMLDRIVGPRPQGPTESLGALAWQLHEAADGATAAVL